MYVVCAEEVALIATYSKKAFIDIIIGRSCVHIGVLELD